MINKKILAELKKKKPGSTIYRLINKIRRELGYRITKEEAACILAGNLGIDITKFVSNEVIDKLKNISTSVKIIETKGVRTQKEYVLKIKGINTKIPFVANKIISDCSNMAEAYQLFYLLENSIRFFIVDTLDKKYPSKDWWDKEVPNPIHRNVEDRMSKERANRWHAKRGGHPILYTNFSDLKRIITSKWHVFKKYFPDQHWVISRFNDLELSRNIFAHNNPLPQGEIRRIKLYFKDWISQVKVT